MATTGASLLPASANLLGAELHGRTGERWKIIEVVSVKPGHTPGHFSYTYKAQNSMGHVAFVKASDLSMFSNAGPDFLQRLLAAGAAHQFERTILDHCSGNNMDRVVLAVDYGDYEVDHEGYRDRVFFIIFELASGDLRAHVDVTSQPSLLWICTALRNYVTGMRQLHAGMVCHNDFKPANALVFDDDLQKVADLGRATSNIASAPHDQYICAGDLRYAAPEQIYGANGTMSSSNDFDRKRAGDLFSLGSVIYFVLTKRMLTPAIVQALPADQRPQTVVGGWQNDFSAVLPHWRLQFNNLLAELKVQTRVPRATEQEVLDTLMAIITQLCEPDPQHRGHPSNKRGNQDPYGLERYVTQFDLLARKAALLRR